jgi:hypothetical protein
MRYPIGSDSAAFSAEISAIMAETALCRDNSRLSTQIKLSGPQLPFRVFSPMGISLFNDPETVGHTGVRVHHVGHAERRVPPLLGATQLQPLRCPRVINRAPAGPHRHSPSGPQPSPRGHLNPN